MDEKKTWMDYVTTLDRRWIFILVALAVIIPLWKGVVLPVNVTPPAQSIYDYVNGLKEGDPVMIVFDYDPASEAELYPMSLAIMRHCFDKKLRVLSFTMWPNGAAVIDRAFNQMEQEYPDIERGVDFVNFGFQVGGALVIIAMGQDIRNACPSDYRGYSTANMKVLEGIKTLKDLKYIIDLAAGSTIDWWVAYGVQRYHFTLGAGCTAVSATQYYPYLDTGQINGLLGGLKGAAEYEWLSGHKDRAIKGMTAQSWVHALIVVLVIISNIFYFITRKKR
ncbi:MAG: hypothetical protein ABIC40_04130 [bacterium]